MRIFFYFILGGCLVFDCLSKKEKVPHFVVFGSQNFSKAQNLSQTHGTFIGDVCTKWIKNQASPILFFVNKMLMKLACDI